MATSPEYKEYVLEQLAPIHPVWSRNMFGGVGLYSEEVEAIFALITSSDELFFKVDEENRADYEAIGAEQFENMPYFAPPADALEDEDELRTWVEKSVDVARRAPKKKKK